jgi:micrococcal nuclease
MGIDQMRLLCLTSILFFPLLLAVGCSDGGTGAPDTNAGSEQPTVTQAEQRTKAIPKPFNSKEPEREWRTVKRVIDGNTLELENGEKVRLIGVDCPETGEQFWKKARSWTRRLSEDKYVWLEYDQTRKDKYGRTLAYVHVFVPGGPRKYGVDFDQRYVVNEEVISEGWGRAYTKYPFKYMDKYRELEKRAKEAAIGLWPIFPLEEETETPSPEKPKTLPNSK